MFSFKASLNLKLLFLISIIQKLILLKNKNCILWELCEPFLLIYEWAMQPFLISTRLVQVSWALLVSIVRFCKTLMFSCILFLVKNNNWPKNIWNIKILRKTIFDQIYHILIKYLIHLKYIHVFFLPNGLRVCVFAWMLMVMCCTLYIF